MSFYDTRAARSIAQSADLTGPQLAVLLALCDRKNALTGECFPSVSTIAEDSRFSEATVKRSLDVLEHEKALISRKRRPGTRVYNYTLNLPTIVANDDTAPAQPAKSKRSECTDHQLTVSYKPRTKSINKTTTAKPRVVVDDLKLPKAFEPCRDQITVALSGVNPKTAQLVLDVAKVALDSGVVIQSPAKYLAALVRKHRQGTLDTSQIAPVALSPAPTPTPSPAKPRGMCPHTAAKIVAAAPIITEQGSAYIAGFGIADAAAVKTAKTSIEGQAQRQESKKAAPAQTLAAAVFAQMRA